MDEGHSDGPKSRAKSSTWGGHRVGAGRKPSPLRKLKTPGKALENGLVVFRGGKTDPALAEPPADLPEAHKAVWRAWAPLALASQTLTGDTVPAFGMLCELQVQRQGLLKTFEQDGAEVTAGGMRIYLQCAKQLENLMGRFMLAPFGKPIVSDKPQAAVNPFEQFKQA